MKKIIQILENIMEQLKIMNSNCGSCDHELEELKYFYDDDWYHMGSKVWGENSKEKTFHYCKKCGQVFVQDRVKVVSYDYYYCVNTFKNDEPVQLDGYVNAENKEKAIQKLIDNGVIDSHGYEFLELYVV